MANEMNWGMMLGWHGSCLDRQFLGIVLTHAIETEIVSHRPRLGAQRLGDTDYSYMCAAGLRDPMPNDGKALSDLGCVEQRLLEE
jgi:hypothetical protein